MSTKKLSRRWRRQQPDETSPEVQNVVDIIDQNIESIIKLHMRAEKQVSNHQRTIERITATLGRPGFFYIILFLIILWILGNTIATRFGISVIDSPPFYWAQGMIGFMALLVTISVLITQNRQQKQADQRRHLDLQVSLLIERKVTQLITMVDELRTALPNVENKHDPQTEAMKQAADPHDIIRSLHASWKEADEEVK